MTHTHKSQLENLQSEALKEVEHPCLDLWFYCRNHHKGVNLPTYNNKTEESACDIHKYMY